jgi:hypothetical protein
LDQACCEGEVCNEGFDCDVGPGETLDRGSGATVFSNCLPCGALGIQCCGEGTCLGEDLLCGGALCEACGAIGEQCCEDNTCPASDGVCMEGVCEPLPTAAAMTKSGLTALILTLTAIGLLWMRPRGPEERFLGSP